MLLCLVHGVVVRTNVREARTMVIGRPWCADSRPFCYKDGVRHILSVVETSPFFTYNADDTLALHSIICTRCLADQVPD